LIEPAVLVGLGQASRPNPCGVGVPSGRLFGLSLDGWERYEAEHCGTRAGHYGFLAMKFGDAVLDAFAEEVIKPERCRHRLYRRRFAQCRSSRRDRQSPARTDPNSLKVPIQLDPRTNPYAPGAGMPPPELAGRDDPIHQADHARVMSRKQ
jgi:hypothetical protein